jgi:hypothetical protein
MDTATEQKDEKPVLGDRVKLCGGHRFAGHTGTYLCDRPFAFGGVRPVVKIDHTGDETLVADPETQWRKL